MVQNKLNNIRYLDTKGFKVSFGAMILWYYLIGASILKDRMKLKNKKKCSFTQNLKEKKT